MEDEDVATPEPPLEGHRMPRQASEATMRDDGLRESRHGIVIVGAEAAVRLE